VCQREDDDVVLGYLVWNGEREAIKHRHPTIFAVAPLRCGFRKLRDERQCCVDLVFELRAQTELVRLVLVDLAIDLRNCEPMNS